jgi:hypothetical protein
MSAWAKVMAVAKNECKWVFKNNLWKQFEIDNYKVYLGCEQSLKWEVNDRYLANTF